MEIMFEVERVKNLMPAKPTKRHPKTQKRVKKEFLYLERIEKYLLKKERKYRRHMLWSTKHSRIQRGNEMPSINLEYEKHVKMVARIVYEHPKPVFREALPLSLSLFYSPV